MPFIEAQRDWLRGVVAGLCALSDNRWMMPAAHLATVLTELADVVGRETPGAVVEMGCAAGKTSLRVAAVLRLLGEGPGRPLHLYDTFAGFPEPAPEDEQPPDWRDRERPHLVYPAGGPAELFREWGDGLQPPVVHAGPFDPGAADHPDPIAFALLDGDMYRSLKASLKIVWPRLAPNGVALVHDYANRVWPGAYRAVSEHFSRDAVKREVGRWELHHDFMLLVSKREPGT